MNFNKYFAFLALLVLCLLGQQATEAHFLGKFGHRLDKAAKHVEKVAHHIDNAKKVIEVGGIVAGAIADS
ncbi:uncharacterized protein [Musca autumnalis]|uniref:uncharacterized protein n=1 Tax=Musca autumnalis TaxID=221902 RepID=UPI003CE9F786